MGKSELSNSFVKRIGLTLAVFFGLSSLISLILSIYYAETFTQILSSPSVSVSFFIFLLFLISSYYTNHTVKVLHIIFIIIPGYLTMISESYLTSINGETMIIMGLWVGKIYGLFKKRMLLIVFSTTFAILLTKFLFHYSIVVNSPSDFVYYTVLVVFYSMLFLTIVDSESIRLTEEASVICKQWTREQVYNDIGRSVFSTFLHDYNSDQVSTHLESVEEMILHGEHSDAVDMIRELRKMLDDDNKKINNIKEKIRLSHNDTPEIIDLYSTVEDKVNTFKKLYNLNALAIGTYYHLDDRFKLFAVQIDFVGILDCLLKNAIEASIKNEPISVLISINDKCCRISVTNKGELIPWRESSGNVPVDSFRVGRTTKKNGSGWGVFSMIKRVKANGGTVNISSKNLETEFIIELPVKKTVNHAVKV